VWNSLAPSENRKGNPKFARTFIETEQLRALASDGMQMVVDGHSGEEALAEAARTDEMRELQQSIEEHARYMPSRQGASRRS
jgi:flagellar motor component MotA